MYENSIRQARLDKNLSQVAISKELGLSESAVIRIEQGSGKTTEEEVNKVLQGIKDMDAKPGKIAGRRFADPEVDMKVNGPRLEAPVKTEKAEAKKGNPLAKVLSKSAKA